MKSYGNKFIRESESIGLVWLGKYLCLKKLIKLEKSQLDHGKSLVIRINLLHFSLAFFGKFVGWSTSFRILEFGDVCTFDLKIIVFSFTMGAKCRIRGVFFATTTSILFCEMIGLGSVGKVRFGLEGFSHDVKCLEVRWKSL